MSVETIETRRGASVPSVLNESIAASELLLFCRDLRGTVTDVVVAAAGRALAVHPELGCADQAGGGVGVAVDTDGGVLVPVVRNATDAPLPQVRAEVSRLVEAARAGRLAPDDLGAAAVTVRETASGSNAPNAPNAPDVGASASCILTFGRRAYDAPDLTLALSVPGRAAGAEAGGFFATLVRLLEHPYRRLV